MILLREVNEADIPSLDKLSTMAAERHPGFLNVPSDPEGWKDKIKLSQQSFAGKLSRGQIGKYIFAAEDTMNHSIVGISMVSEQHGTKESPHFFFEVGSEQKFSQTINTGFIHGTLCLKTDSDGPTEIGGLLVDPSCRNTEDRVGRQISFVRFLFIGANKQRFRKKILAELLPPLTKKGKSPLWEAVGRRFTNMDYWEADFLSSKNKEFIFSLFPSGIIHVTFLSAEARNAIGKVSKETEPVMHMLKKVGFKYLNQVDPFDGGPHLTANTDDVVPIQRMGFFTFCGSIDAVSSQSTLMKEQGILSLKESTPFVAVSVSAAIQGDKIYCDDKNAIELLAAKPGDSVVFMPYY